MPDPTSRRAPDLAARWGHAQRMRMIRWLLDRWHARQRAIDVQILWPSCRNMARDLDHARAAFAVHAFRDRAWLALGEDEIIRRIDQLT